MRFLTYPVEIPNVSVFLPWQICHLSPNYLWSYSHLIPKQGTSEVPLFRQTEVFFWSVVREIKSLPWQYSPTLVSLYCHWARFHSHVIVLKPPKLNGFTKVLVLPFMWTLCLHAGQSCFPLFDPQARVLLRLKSTFKEGYTEICVLPFEIVLSSILGLWAFH